MSLEDAYLSRLCHSVCTSFLGLSGLKVISAPMEAVKLQGEQSLFSSSDSGGGTETSEMIAAHWTITHEPSC